MEEKRKERGDRYNRDKLEPSLHPEDSQLYVNRRWTKGATKYSRGNWLKGMKMSEVVDCLERHLSALKRGYIIDDDWDEGLDTRFGVNTHMDGIIVNASMLLHHWFNGYETDLPVYNNNSRIGLDIDGVCADACYSLKVNPKNYRDKDFYESWVSATYNDKELFVDMPLTSGATGLKFEPVVYITARDEYLRPETERWLENSGLPWAPIVFTKDKAKACREYKVDTFVEDNFETFLKLREGGIRCFLLDQPWNSKYTAGPGDRLRIKHINDIFREEE